MMLKRPYMNKSRFINYINEGQNIAGKNAYKPTVAVYVNLIQQRSLLSLPT